MGDLDIIKEQAGYRVRLELDDTPEQPEDDGAVPVLQLQLYGYYRAYAFNSQAEPYLQAFLQFVDRVRKPVDVFERYARIFLGAVKVQGYNIGHVSQYGYLAFDTAAWRNDMQVSAEQLQAEDYLEEIRAWAEGSVYGWIVEKQRPWTKTYADGETEQGSSWEQVESCWGYYGREYAEQAALEALAAEAGEIVPGPAGLPTSEQP
jgi:hypothetical protein